MESIEVYLRNTDKAEVSLYLDSAYPGQRNPWLLWVNGDSCLYIEIYEDWGKFGVSYEYYDDIVSEFDGDPPVVVLANVSGRCHGVEPVYKFVIDLLTRFDGLASDDYINHLWTLVELKDWQLIEGQPFFDSYG